MRALRSVRLVLAAILVTAFPATVLAAVVPSVVGTPPAASAASTCAFVNSAVSDSPTALYQLNDASGSSAADSSGNNHTATISDAGTYDETPGPASCSAGALQFNGTSTTVTPPSSIAPSGSAFTVMGWFNLSSVPSGTNPRVMANSHTDTDGNGFQLVVNGNSESGTFGTGFFDVGAAGGLGTATWTQPITTGTWYFYAGTYNGSTVTAYLDGTQVASGSTSGAVNTGTSGLGIGYDPAYDGDYFPGQLGDVGIYTSALSASQISSLWSAGESTSWSDSSAISSSTCGSFTSYQLPTTATTGTLTVGGGGGGSGGGGLETGGGANGGAGGKVQLNNFTVNPSTTPYLNYEVGCGGGVGGSQPKTGGSGGGGSQCLQAPCGGDGQGGSSASGGASAAGWGSGAKGGEADTSSSAAEVDGGGGGGGGTAACLGTSSSATCATASDLPLAAAGGGGGGGDTLGNSGGAGGGGSTATEQWYGESGSAHAGEAQAGDSGDTPSPGSGGGAAGGGAGGGSNGGTGTFSSSSGGGGGGGGSTGVLSGSGAGGGSGGGGYSGGGGAASSGSLNSGDGGGASSWVTTANSGTSTFTGGGGSAGGSEGKGSAGSITLSLSGSAIQMGSVSNQVTGVNRAATGVTPTVTDGSPNSGFSCCTWSAMNLPTGISISSSTGAMTGTPTAAGSYSVRLVAEGSDSSSAYIASTNFTWYVTSVSLSISTQTNGLNTSVSKTFSATENAEGSSATCCTWSASGLPTGLSINTSTGQVTGAPSAAGAYTSAAITATDSAGATATADFTWYVTTVSSVTLANQTTTAGNTVNVTPSDTYNNEGSSATCCTWSATGLPSGISINSSSGAITGSTIFAGTYSVMVTATDSVDASASKTISWTVQGGPLAYAAVSFSPNSAAATSSATIPFTLGLFDQYGNSTTSSSTTTVDLDTSSTGGFFASGINGSAVTSLTVPANTTSITGYYADTVAGRPQIITYGTGLDDVSQEPITIDAGSAYQVGFVQEPPTSPATTTAGQAMSPAPTVQIEDQYGNAVSDSGATVTLTLNNDGTITSGASAQTNSFGLATFSSLVIDTAGTYTLTASSTAVSHTGNSSSFTISAAAASKLVFATPPSNVEAGQFMTPSPTVQIEDQYGNPVADSDVQIVLYRGSTGVAVQDTNANGLATFSELVTDPAGTYTFSATSSGLTAATSGSITVSPASASKLVFVQGPSGVTAGQTMSPSPTVQVEDQYGNAVSDSGATVTLSLNNSGTITSGGSASTNGSGLATFSSLVIDYAGSYTLTASSGTLTAATSGSITVSPASASVLVFVQGPSGVTAGQAMSPSPTVQVEDQYGNAVSDSGATVTLSLNNSGTITSGGSASTNGSGLATFSSLVIDNAGSYTLTASSGTLTAATSGSITVSPASASKLVFVQGPSGVTAGQAMSPAPTVQVQDAYGNSVADSGVTVTLLPDTGSISAGSTATTDSTGLATFNGLIFSAGGLYTVSASAPDLSSSASSSSFAVDSSPDITSAASASFNLNQAGLFTVQTEEYPVASISLLGSLPSGLSFQDNGDGTGTISGTPSLSGTDVVTVDASNGIGSPATQTLAIVVDAAPTFTSATTADLVVDTAGSFTVTTSAGYPTATTLTWSGLAKAGLTFKDNGNGTATISGTPTLAKTFTPVLRASNGVLSSYQTLKIVVQATPAFTSAATTTYSVGSAKIFTVTTKENPSATLSIASGSLPQGVVFHSSAGSGEATVSGKPAAGSAGVYNISLQAANGYATTDQSFTLTVDGPPTITSGSSAVFDKASAGSFEISTTPGYPTNVSLSSSTLPTGLHLTDNKNGTGTISGTPTATVGTHVVTLTATNGVKKSTEKLSITVDAAPAFPSGAKSTYRVGTAKTVTVVTTGLPKATVSIGSGSLPDGVTFHDNTVLGTGTLSGTPAAGTAGIYNLTLAATNSVGTVTETYVLTVDR